MFQRFLSGALEFFTDADVAKIAVVGVVLLIGAVFFLEWAERTRETIKLWPPEISAPESEEMKACRTLQVALHDEIQSLENEQTSAYKMLDNEHTALNEETRLRIEAMERDRVIQKETGSSSSNDNERAVIHRISQLENDIDYRDKMLRWIRQTIADRSQEVYSSCAAIMKR